MIVTILATILVISVLVFFHELGHFLAAKWSGVRVERFSFGLPPKAFTLFRWGETEYLVSWIPFGGYVKMAGEHPDEETEGHPYEFTSKSNPIKIAIIVAGPLFNMVLAFLIFWALLMFKGIETMPTTRVGSVEPESPAAAAGLKAGDVLTAVNDRPVETWEQILQAFDFESGETNSVTLRRDSRELSLVLTGIGPDSDGEMRFGLVPDIAPIVGSVQTGMPADSAGILPGDRIVAVNGRPIRLWSELTDLIWDRSGQPTEITWVHQSDTLSAVLSPEESEYALPDGEVERRGLIGISRSTDYRRLAPLKAMIVGGQRTLYSAQIIFHTITLIISGRLSGKRAIGGPITIARMAGEAARTSLIQLLFFIAIVSVNLGILNLLPIPMFDGGQIMIFSIEAITRRKLSERKRMILQQIGLAIIILLMVYITINDLLRIFD